MLSSGGVLKFSTDSLAFDTVFTATGNYTTYFKIYNIQNQDISISGIHLESGVNSFFHINVDGFAGNTQSNIKIRAHDSIYVFATVSIDPTNAANPFFISDHFIATLNGKNFSLPFTAYGQNAHYIVDSEISTNSEWKNDLPYVIIHSAGVDSFTTLTIDSGCRIYVNQDSRLFVDGTLITKGTASSPVVFQGDRLDRAYFGYVGFPGEWGGLYFDFYSHNCNLGYTNFINGGGATTLGDGSFLAAVIQVDSDIFYNGTPKLTLDHCLIQNSIGYGIISFGATIKAQSCLVNTCGAQAIALLLGGTYNLTNCTFACYNLPNVVHQDNGTAAILNYFATDDTHYTSGKLSATLTNCIIWGSLDSELFFDRKLDAADTVTLDHCIYKIISLPSYVRVINGAQNQDPLFSNYNMFDYHIANTASPAYRAGTNVPGLTTDLDGKPWSGAFDIGCYKIQ